MPSIHDNRIAISALSKSNIDTAYNEEIMVDKLTGEFLIKTPNGDTVSYSHKARIDNAISMIKKVANDNLVYGDIYQLQSDNIVFPLLPEAGTNILNSIESINTKFSKILFNIDLTSLTVNNTGISNIDNDPTVSIEFNIGYVDGTTTPSIILFDLLSNVNHDVLDISGDLIFPYIDASKEINSLNIISIAVHNTVYNHETSTIIDVDADKIRHIIHSIHVLLS